MARVFLLATLLATGTAVVLFSADCASDETGTGECIYESSHCESPSSSGCSSVSLLTDVGGKVSAIEVDTDRSLVYWTDRSNEVLWRATLGGDFSDAEAVQTGMGEPHDVAVRASTGAVYWTDKDAGSVYVSYDSGATREVFASGLEQPVGAEVDDENSILYVGDFEAGSIFSFDLESGKSTTFASDLGSPRSLLLFENSLYFVALPETDDPDAVSSGSIYRLSTSGEGEVELVVSGLTDPDCLALLDDNLLISDEGSELITYDPLVSDDGPKLVTYGANRTLLTAAAPRALAAYSSSAAQGAKPRAAMPPPQPLLRERETHASAGTGTLPVLAVFSVAAAFFIVRRRSTTAYDSV